MRRPYKTYLVLILYSLFLIQGVHARSARVYGYVVDQDNIGIELANVVATKKAQSDNVQSTNGQEWLGGTATNKNGYYELLLDETDTVVLTFSMVGYTTVRQRIIDLHDVLNVNVQLLTDEQLLTEIEVRGIKHTQGMMDRIDAEATRIMPDATGGSIESLLITFAGVSQTNELSSQYNVRGGSFDENEVYVNGIEVHRPLLIRSGQQEGLSFVNPEMVENVHFSAGGFGAQFGDKMSSVLDITYKQPDKFEATVSAGLLGAQVYVGHGDSTYSQMHGIRYKTSKYMLGGLSTAGNYQPTYIDYQTYITWKVKGGRTKDEGRRTKDEGQRPKAWQMAFLANVSQNDYRFSPDSLSESFGGQDAKNLSIYYEGQEKDKFLTAFAALSANGQKQTANGLIDIGFDLSGFYTNERENFDITGQYVLSNGDAQTANSQRPTANSPEATVDVLGTGIFHQHARNTLQAGVITLAHHGDWTSGQNRLSWGLSGQAELISDHINEWEWRDSAGYSLPNTANSMELYYAMRGDSSMRSARLQAYIQNMHKWHTTSGQWILTVGGRLQWWSWNNEVLPSPRASVEWIPGWKRDVCFRLATGLYYQAPFYKELRDTVTDDLGITRIRLNRDLRAQRSVHVVLGSDYYFRAWGRPFKLTAEAYYKYIDRMESYTVDNVRVRYSGKNDSEGYAAGLDLKLYGELVPGADSWISFSTMTARQRNLKSEIPNQKSEWIPSPTESRWNFSMLFQDYIPQLPQLKFHLKMQFSEGQPFYLPRNNQVWNRMPAYKRIDLGATYIFNEKTAKFMRAPSARHVKQWAIQFEVFNLVGWKNVNSYFWVADAYNRQWASPNYLTGRRYNLKITVDFR